MKTTDDRRLALSEAELYAMQASLNVLDRGGFYAIYNGFSNSDQASVQGRISTFSGDAGGAAFAANRILQELYGPDSTYNGIQYSGLYYLSQEIAQEGLNYIRRDIETDSVGGNGTGDLPGNILSASAANAWANNQNRDMFPGNIFTPVEVGVSAAQLVATLAPAVLSAIFKSNGDGTFTPYEDAGDRFIIALQDVGSVVSKGSLASFLAAFVSDDYAKSRSDVGGATITGPNGIELSVGSNGSVNGFFDYGATDFLGQVANFTLELTTTGYIPGFDLKTLIQTYLSDMIEAPLRAGWTPADFSEIRSSGTGHDGDTQPGATYVPNPDAAVWTQSPTGGNDAIAGKDGFFGRGGRDEIYAGAGNDVVFGQGGDDKLYGEEDDDILWGGRGDDELDGGEGNDVLRGGEGDDTLFGSIGEDILSGGDIQVLLEDDGTDTADYSEVELDGEFGMRVEASDDEDLEEAVFTVRVGGDGSDRKGDLQQLHSIERIIGTDKSDEVILDTRLLELEIESFDMDDGTDAVRLIGEEDEGVDMDFKEMEIEFKNTELFFATDKDDTLRISVSSDDEDDKSQRQEHGAEPDPVRVFGGDGDDEIEIVEGEEVFLYGGGGEDTLTAADEGKFELFGVDFDQNFASLEDYMENKDSLKFKDDDARDTLKGGDGEDVFHVGNKDRIENFNDESDKITIYLDREIESIEFRSEDADASPGGPYLPSPPSDVDGFFILDGDYGEVWYTLNTYHGETEGKLAHMPEPPPGVPPGYYTAALVAIIANPGALAAFVKNDGDVSTIQIGVISNSYGFEMEEVLFEFEVVGHEGLLSMSQYTVDINDFFSESDQRFLPDFPPFNAPDPATEAISDFISSLSIVDTANESVFEGDSPEAQTISKPDIFTQFSEASGTSLTAETVDAGQIDEGARFVFTSEQLGYLYTEGAELLDIGVDDSLATLAFDADAEVYTLDILGGIGDVDVVVEFTVGLGDDTVTGSFTFDVQDVNLAPTFDLLALGDIEGAAGSSVTFTAEQLLANAVDPDGDAVSLTSVEVSELYGSVTDNGDGTYTVNYDPAEGFDAYILPVTLTFTDGQAEGFGMAVLNVLQDVVTDLTLDGTPDADVLEGGDGNDIIKGYQGSDTIIAGLGNDYLRGDGPAGERYKRDRDVFELGEATGMGNDVIADFDTNNWRGGEKSFDTVNFSFAGRDWSLSTGRDVFRFARFIERDGDGRTDALLDGRDLVFVFDRDADGNITDSLRLVDVVGKDGLGKGKLLKRASVDRWEDSLVEPAEASASVVVVPEASASLLDPLAVEGDELSGGENWIAEMFRVEPLDIEALPTFDIPELFL